jgi:hypothetical protein
VSRREMLGRLAATVENTEIWDIADLISIRRAYR